MTSNDYMNKILQYSNILMVSQENGEDAELILNSEMAYDVAKELLYMNGKYFVNDDVDSFEKLVNEHKVLGVEVICHKGGANYVLQPVFDDNGETISDEPDVVYVEEGILDSLDKNKIKCYEFIEL